MNKKETWLVCHDFSEQAELASATVAAELEGVGGKLLLFHAHPMPQLRPEEAWGEATFEMEESLRFQLSGIATRLRERHPKLEIEVKVVAAKEPAKAILDEAARLDVDHIALGTHSRKGLSHLLLGSVAERVAREAPVSVTIIRQKKKG